MPDTIQVLYVDDEPDLLELGKRFLETDQEFSVTITESPEDAFAILSRKNIDAIVSDYQMPEMDGIVFLKKIRERFTDLPFILFTGRGREEVVIEALNNGADFYLQKGGYPEAQYTELASKIRQAVRRRKAEQSYAENRDYLERIYSSVQGGIVIIDAKTHEILDLNPAAEKMMETSKDQITGKVCHRFICPAEQGRCPITDLHQEVDNSERVLMTADGKRRDIIKYVIPFSHHGRECLLETFVDNTERKIAADNLQAAYEKLTVAEEELRQNYEALSRKEQALRESEQQLRETNTYLSNLITYAANPIVTWDVNSQITGFNKAFEKLTGFSESNVLGHDFDILFPDESRKDSLDHVLRALFGEKWEGVEVPVKTIHGKTRTVLWNSANVYGTDGITPVATIATGTDITERKKGEMELFRKNTELNEAYEQLAQTEEELRQNYEQLAATEEELRAHYDTLAAQEHALRVSEEKYRLLTEVTDDIIYMIDLSGRITHISPQISRYGYRTEEVISKNISEFVLEEDLPTVMADMGTILSAQKPVLTQLRIRDAAGGIHWMEDNGAPVYSSTGPVTAVSGILRDITGRIMAEAALKESEEKFRILVESSRDGILITDITGKLIFSNAAAGNIVEAADYHTFIGKKNILEFVAPASQEAVLRDFSEVLQGRDAYLVNYQLITEKGREIWVECIGRKILFRNSPAMIVSFRDITERRKADEALRQANKKLHLLSSITRHDIKNQLMTLDGYLGLLKKKIPADCCEDEMSRIRKVSSQISSMIQFTKDYQQVGISSPVWLDLRALVDGAEKGVAPGAFTVKNDIPAGMEVYADPLIAKVFFNLVDNALRHGGAVTTIRFFVVKSNGDCTIVCEDNGAGIAPDMKKKLFRKGFGTNNGFGLFISREVLDITGITIHETGEPAKGARFEMTVPNGSFRVAAGK
jgi:PAS domain S-box-containing protein